MIPTVIRALKRIILQIGKVGYWRTHKDSLNYSIAEIGKNTEKSPGDLKKNVVAQTLHKYNQLTML